MKLAMLSPIAWRTPPVHYGPWELTTSLLTEALIKRGIDVTLFATGDSKTDARLISVCKKGYEEDASIDPKVWESLHISKLMDMADSFDIIHNNFDFLPLTYTGNIQTPVVTTIHGFSSEKIIPVYKKYNNKVNYVAISDSDRSGELNYIRTIHHGINLDNFTYSNKPKDYLLFFGRIHPDKGTKEAIEIAKSTGMKLIISGIIQDKKYFENEIKPHIDDKNITYVGTSEKKKRDELLGGARVLLHPINFDEPFGLAVIESMACGTPVIAINRGSMSELIIHEKNGFLVSNIKEAVDAVLNINKIDRTFCREHVKKNFTVDIMADNYLSVYDEILKKESREDKRPWGFYKILEDEEFHKVKRIHVYPGKRLSLQRHQKRSEHWYVIEGKGVITLDDKKIDCFPGISVDIPKAAVHRVENTGDKPLTFIETQTGNYFGEDDIERIEDDFGRK